MKLNKLKRLQKYFATHKYKCKKDCYKCCTGISFLKEELTIMKKELRKQWYKTPPNWKGRDYCEYLTTEWRCSIYNARPMICRAFSDIKFIFKWPEKKIATQSCTYWSQESFVRAPKEFEDYWIENIENPVYNENAEYILNSLVPNWIQLPDNL